jgi:hypothetical protein
MLNYFPLYIFGLLQVRSCNNPSVIQFKIVGQTIPYTALI